MLLPIPIIIFILLLVYAIKNAKQKANFNKHVVVRIGVLLLSIALIFLIIYLTEGDRGLLGSFYFSAYFIGVWLLYLLVEAICLFAVKQNKLGRINLIILVFAVFILWFGIFVFSSFVH